MDNKNNKDGLLDSYMEKNKVREPQLIDIDKYVRIVPEGTTQRPSRLVDEQNPAGKRPGERKQRPQPKKNQPEKRGSVNKQTKAPKVREGSHAENNNQRRRPQQSNPQRTGRNTQNPERQQRRPDGTYGERPVNRDQIRKTNGKQIHERDRQTGNNPKRPIETSPKKNQGKKKISKPKSKSSKKFTALLVGVMIVAVFIVGFIMLVGKPISEIVVEGEKTYSGEQIISAAGILTGDNMFRVREKRVSTVVSSVLPYVDNVKISRKISSGNLVLKINETKDKYMIIGNKKYICIDDNNKVLSVKKKKLKAGQYKLNGFENKDEVNTSNTYSPGGTDKKRFEKARQLIKVLETNGLKNANVIELENLNDIIIVYDSRINIYIGEAEKPESKLAMVADIIKNQTSKTTTGYIEARYADRIYFKEGSMVQV